MTSYSSLGPVFEKWEADFGRTFVLGSDPLKHKMQHDVGRPFAEGKLHFHETPNITNANFLPTPTRWQKNSDGNLARPSPDI
jgi:hypothetical protein